MDTYCALLSKILKHLAYAALLSLLSATMSLVPVLSYAQEPEVYTEDFDDGAAQGWLLDQGWGVDGGMLYGRGHAWAHYTRSRWGDRPFTLGFTLRHLTEGGGMHVNIHVRGPDRYAIGLRHGGMAAPMLYLYLFKQRGDTPPPSSRWIREVVEYNPEIAHKVEIAAEQGNIKVRVDGMMALPYSPFF